MNIITATSSKAQCFFMHGIWKKGSKLTGKVQSGHITALDAAH